MKRFLAGIGSLIVLAALLIGIPAVLMLVAGNPIPSGEQLQQALTQPDYGGEFLLGTLLPIIAWIAWLTFAISVLTVLPSIVRGLEPPRIPGLHVQQRTAAALLGTIIIMFTAFTGTASAAVADAPAPYSASQDAAGSTANTASTTADEQIADATAQAVDAVDSDAPRYETHAGDTLWTIAQDQLGDGKRYTEIAQLNYNVVQEDGGALTPDSHWIAPGWTLVLPADAAAAPSDAAPAAEVAAAETPAPVAVTVVAGDTLWGIAEAQLGSGDRYPELFEASRAAVQADGQQLSNPDLILPGWNVVVPQAAAPTAPVEAPPEDAGAVSASSDVASAAAFEVLQSAGDVANTSTPDETDFVAAVADSPVATAGGISSMLAASLLGLLGVRRAQQRKRRTLGQRVVVSSSGTDTEWSLRTIADAHGLQLIDQAVRIAAAAVPARLMPLALVSYLDETVSLHFAEATELGTPFTADNAEHTIWSVHSLAVGSHPAAPVSPFPALVTLGHDDSGAHVLVNLEHFATLVVTGAADTTAAILRAMTLELVGGKWAAGSRVWSLGAAPEFAEALGASGLHDTDTVAELVTALRERADVLSGSPAQDAAFSEDTLRGRPFATEDTLCEVVVLASPISEVEQREIADVLLRMPRSVMVLVTETVTGDAHLRVDETGSATLTPGGVTVSAQMVGGVAYHQLLASLAAAAAPSRALTEIAEIDEETRERPRATPTPSAEDTALRIMWGKWEALVRYPLAETSTENLVGALKLIDARAFDPAASLAHTFSTPLREEMIASVVDAAHELSTRSLASGDIHTARIAALIGERVDPFSEIPVRDRLRVEATAHDFDQFEEVVARLNRQLAALSDELDEETRDLIDEVRNEALARPTR